VSWLLRGALSLLRGLAGPAWRSFQESLDDPAAAQERTLRRLLARSARSRFGQSQGLAGAAPETAFERLQPTDYASLRALIESDIATGSHHFSPERPRLYERTSGSGGPAKYIPYDTAVRAACDRMFRIWAYDLLQSGLRLHSGRAFMSVSPPLLGQRRAGGGVPLGVALDTDYLATHVGLLLRPFLAVPARVLALSGADDFKDVVVAHLLAASDLEVVSVWNPTYWLVLLEHASRHLARLTGELRAGEIGRAGLRFRFRPLAAQRIGRVACAAEQGWHTVWPHLALISCWTDAEAAGPAAGLGRLFPRVWVQGKGLLATEAAITVPIVGAPAPVPLVDDVYLELLQPDGRLLPLAQWRLGDQGELVVTQAGGFLRYRMHDQVVVAGFFRATPCLRFQGRSGGVVDLVGEKLSEELVRSALQGLRTDHRLLALCPVASADPPFYALFCDAPTPHMADAVDAFLYCSPHYRVARELHQLAPIRLVARPGLLKDWQQAMAGAGIAEGNVKATSLVVNRELAARLWAALTQRSA